MARFTPQQARVARIIAQEARKEGIKDPAVLIAAAMEESSLRPGAHGDTSLGGTGSWGLFQLYTGGGMGTGIPVSKLTNPAFNAGLIARAWAQKGGRTASGPGAILRYFQQVGRGANNQAAYKRALPYYEAAKQLLASPGASVPTSAPGTPARAVAAPPVPAQAGVPFNMAAAQKILAANTRDTLAGRIPPAIRFQQLANLVSAARQSLPVGAATPENTAPAKPASRQMGLGPVGGAVYGGVLGKKGNIIGTPYSGTHTLGNWESDDAVDISVPIGTPIYAPKPGVIGNQFGSLGSSGRFQGIRVHLQIPGNELYYAHLSKTAPGIKPGVHVKAGQLIGYTGSANGVAHLHLGIRSGDPRKVLGL